MFMSSFLVYVAALEGAESRATWFPRFVRDRKTAWLRIFPAPLSISMAGTYRKFGRRKNWISPSALISE